MAGNHSIGVGTNINCNADSSFVFGDGSETFNIGADNTANFLVNSGFRIWTANPVSSNIGTRLAAGGSSWIALSDSNMKTNRIAANTQDILNRISELPMEQWNYKHQAGGPQHIGPMAQDFWKAFHLGDDSLGIETIDADGVLFAAVQELAKENEALRSELARQISELAELKALVRSQLQYGLHDK